MRQRVGRVARPAGMVGAVALAVAVLVCPCTSVVDGSPVAGDEAAAAAVPALEVGNYPTKPAPPLGMAGNPDIGAIVEGQRMANNVIGPWEVDPALVTGYATSALVLKNTKSLQFMMPESVAAAGAPHTLVNGFFSSREEPGQKILQNAVPRFPDPDAARAAAKDMGDAALRQEVITPPVTSVSIPGHPEAIATSHILKQPEVEWTVVRSFLAHGPYVLTQLVQGAVGEVDPVPMVAKTLDVQVPLIDEFKATDPAKFAELELDPTGLLERTLPVPVTAASVNQRAVYERRGALHFQIDPVRSSKVFDEAGVDLVAMGKSTVYQARDAGGARVVADAFFAEQRVGTTPAEGVKELPGSRCVQQSGDRGVYCLGTADRYVFEVGSGQLRDAHQQLAAQYTILMAE
ncbi:DUF7373 family lipoprotein [Mycobacterium hubeiense]|uniref:DUF7373 family lipoprotein n=1 Tax=Mycobacterium hubeiense TaxID=1867256 RepID=UPI001E54552D|nr:hypothetical protein [Mycobacterium sp. QGD 101]